MILVQKLPQRLLLAMQQILAWSCPLPAQGRRGLFDVPVRYECSAVSEVPVPEQQEVILLQASLRGVWTALLLCVHAEQLQPLREIFWCFTLVLHLND